MFSSEVDRSATIPGDVACRQLGYPGASNFTRTNHFGSIHTSRFSMDDVACRGDEAKLQDCRHLSSGDCDSSEGAGVICHPRITTPSPPPTTKSPLQCEVRVHNGDWALSGVIDGLTMKNTRNAHQNDRGLEKFSIAISNSTSGPWRIVLNGSLPDVRNFSCNNFSLPEELSEEARTASAVKLQVLSWYGLGAGLQYLEVHSHQPSGIGAGATVGVLLLVVVLVALVGFAWKKRERVRSRDRYETIRKYMTQQSQQALVDPPKEDDMADVDLH